VPYLRYREKTSMDKTSTGQNIFGKKQNQFSIFISLKKAALQYFSHGSFHLYSKHWYSNMNKAAANF